MNSDKNVISSFGFEWEKYDQESILNIELRKTFDEYFDGYVVLETTNKELLNATG